MSPETKTGLIIKSIGGLYGVRPVPFERQSSDDGGIYLCRARGAFRHESISPLVGDFVHFQPDVSGASKQASQKLKTADHVITEILERSNSLIRPPLANLTHIFVVIPATNPAPDLLTADKLISIAEYNKIEPVIIVNKSDLDSESAEKIARIYSPNFSTFILSMHNGDSISNLKAFIASLFDKSEKTVIAAFAGVSGAGKSTLLSALFPSHSIKSGELSQKIARGKNTTRHCELYPFETVNGVSFFADTPGFSLLDFTKFNFFPSAELPYLFRELTDYIPNCRYTSCTHTIEQDCGIIIEVKKGSISPSRHKSYCTIYDDLRKKPDWKRKQELENGRT